MLAVEERILEPSFPVALAYDKYLTTYTYFFVGEDSVIIRQGPSFAEPILRKAEYGNGLITWKPFTWRYDGGTEQWHP